MKNKDQQAQQYAEKKTAAAFDYISPNIDTTENLKIPVFTGEQIKQAYLDGYTACEQSKEDSEATLIQGWVAKLRDVLEKLVADGDIEPIHVSVDEIINRVKKEK